MVKKLPSSRNVFWRCVSECSTHRPVQSQTRWSFNKICPKLKPHIWSILWTLNTRFERSTVKQSGISLAGFPSNPFSSPIHYVHHHHLHRHYHFVHHVHHHHNLHSLIDVFRFFHHLVRHNQLVKGFQVNSITININIISIVIMIKITILDVLVGGWYQRLRPVHGHPPCRSQVKNLTPPVSWW